MTRKGCGVSIDLNKNSVIDRFMSLVRGGRAKFVLPAAAVVLIAAVAAAVWMGGSNEDTEVPLARVERGPLTISVIQSGTIQNRQREIVKCEVEGTTTILSLVAEGTNIQKGDLLVELDSSRLQDDKAQQEISVGNAKAAFINAESNLGVTQSQSESDVTQAKLKHQFAEIDLEKYLEGEWPAALKKAESDIILANEDLRRAQEKFEWSRKLATEGYIAKTECDTDELSVKQSQIKLELAENALNVLEEYTHKRDMAQLQSDVDEAAKELDRTKAKAEADVLQASENLKAKKGEFERQQAKLDKMNDQIAKCRIIAPVSGMVVYATTGQGNWRGNTEPLDEGQQVRERQDLIFLPTTAAMMAEVKIHESSLRKVTRDMPVRVTVDAMPGKTFWGRVSKIGILPDAQAAWMNPDLKVYNTQIDIEGDGSALRPGMTCLAEIVVEQHADAVYVPLQSLTRVGGQSAVYVPSSDGPRMQPVTVGLDNNRVVHVLDGLAAGQEVLLSPPLAPSEAPEAAQAQMATTQPAPQPAAIAATTQPADAAAATQPTEIAFDPAKLQDMTPEQRRVIFEQLPPEQRDALRKQFGGRRGRGEGGQRGERGQRGEGGQGAQRPAGGE